MSKWKTKLIQMWAAALAVARNADNFSQLRAEIAQLESDKKTLQYRAERLTAQLELALNSSALYQREAFAAENTLTAIKNYLRGCTPMIQKDSVLSFYRERTL